MESIKNEIRLKKEDIHPVKYVDSICPAINKTELQELFLKEKKKFLLVNDALRNDYDDQVYLYCVEVSPANYKDGHSLDCAYFLKKDLESLKGKYKELTFSPAKIYDLVSYESETRRLNLTIEDYKNKVHTLEEELDGCKRRLTTISATGVLSSKTVEKWKGYLKTAVKLAVHCCSEPKKYKKSDFEDILKTMDSGPMPREAMSAFRNGLPENLKQEQGSPGNN